jgi:hypothetical protein
MPQRAETNDHEQSLEISNITSGAARIVLIACGMVRSASLA